MLSPDGSDYRYAEDVRVLNKIIRETRKQGLDLMNDDIDLEDIQGELEVRCLSRGYIREVYIDLARRRPSA